VDDPLVVLDVVAVGAADPLDGDAVGRGVGGGSVCVGVAAGASAIVAVGSGEGVVAADGPQDVAARIMSTSPSDDRRIVPPRRDSARGGMAGIIAPTGLRGATSLAPDGIVAD